MKITVLRKRGKQTQNVEMSVGKTWTVHQLKEEWQKKGATRSAPALPPRAVAGGKGASAALR